MTKLTLDISMSLDGFIAGPNRTADQPLGDGGDRLHEWILGLASWRELHGLSGGTKNAGDDVVRESVDSTGAVLMGRRMFSGGEGRWEDDPVADGWWGDDPPFGVPVFQIHLVPVLLGDGVRLLDALDPERVKLERTRVIDSPTVTHLRYRVV